MKAFFVQKLQELKKLFFVEIGAFTSLSNHTHLLIRFEHPDKVDADSAIYRWNRYHPKTYQKSRLSETHREYVRGELTDVSFFMKKLNTLMTREYNRRTGSKGTLWERRFRSTVVERGRAMLMAGAYIELNSFRASLVSRPEEYEYSSIWWLKKGNRGDLVSTEILDETLHVSMKQGISDGLKKHLMNPEKASQNKYRRIRSGYITGLYKAYLKYIYEQGSRAPKRELIHGRSGGIRITEAMQKKLDARLGLGDNEADREDGDADGYNGHTDGEGRRELSRGAGLCQTMKNLTMGKYIGSRRGAKQFYAKHVDPGYSKQELRRKHKRRWMNGVSGNEGVWGVFNVSRYKSASASAYTGADADMDMHESGSENERASHKQKENKRGASHDCDPDSSSPT
jgi:REP element-mobilizing transposase RayT